MKTFQELIEYSYPDKSIKGVYSSVSSLLTDYSLDLKEYKNLEWIALYGNEQVGITSINLSECKNLKTLSLQNNRLTSVDFLNTLTNPEKLEELDIFNNNFQPTDIKVFSKFVNLKVLRMGTVDNQHGLKANKRNKFYGSLESLKNLAKLEQICIEATDIDQGLEYLPFSLVEKIKEIVQNWWRVEEQLTYSKIECSPHGTNAKVKVIQDQLRPFNYDLEAWMLAHPNLMYKAKPELFFDNEVKSKWVSTLRDKLANTQSKLNDIKQNNPNETKKISRLELKLDNLKLIQKDISNNQLIERLQQKELVKKEDKTTQTELFVEVKK